MFVGGAGRPAEEKGYRPEHDDFLHHDDDIEDETEFTDDRPVYQLRYQNAPSSLPTSYPPPQLPLSNYGQGSYDLRYDPNYPPPPISSSNYMGHGPPSSNTGYGNPPPPYPTNYANHYHHQQPQQHIPSNYIPPPISIPSMSYPNQDMSVSQY
jgi:hypothetical protein